ncbi:hypothetical protein DPM19_26035 [Actinomadura craniellae]|uniref:TPM domain-containing protein n=1 Tax=Actinomadura craniellae TaxID=2231787 RepID=A0A365GZC0_9ACTN|nr:hypothetical protein [Actinomadura craniellae]RAY12185.1 hypothetical protein DPM19_26035 [Actinomadura craniellae]
MATAQITRNIQRIALILLTGLVALLALMPAARADTVSQIAGGLMNSRLYVTSGGQAALPPAQRPAVTAALDRARTADIRVVVTQAGATQSDLVRMLNAVRERVGKGDTYVAITADNKMLAVSDDLSGQEINQIVARTDGDVGNRLIQFAGLADREAADNAAAGRTSSLVLLGVLALVVVGTVGLVTSSKRRRRRQEAQDLAELKQGVAEDVTRLGEDIAALDLDVMDPRLDPVIRADYTHALDSYDRAKAAAEGAARPADIGAVTTALEDGRYAMTATRARLAGEPVPERRPPCFFNPQHGPSAEDVLWAPPGGTPRTVPTCTADAEAVRSGGDPDARLVPTAAGRRPYWEAGPAYAPYAGGYYAGYGGLDLLSGMMIGTALGSMLGGGWGLGGFGGYPGGDMGGDFGGDTGDLGGGWDFGSGDFGGGGGFGGDF